MDRSQPQPGEIVLNRRGYIDVAIAGMLTWAAYAVVETVFAVILPRIVSPWTYTRPSLIFTVGLTILFPLVGAAIAVTAHWLFANFSAHAEWSARDESNVVYLTLACAANAMWLPGYSRIFMLLLAAFVIIAIVRWSRHEFSAWSVSILMLAPLWVVRDFDEQHTLIWKAIVCIAIVGGTIAVAHWMTLARYRRLRLLPLLLLPVVSGVASLLAIPAPRDQIADSISRSAGVQPPNVILVMLDTVRADHLSVYNYPRKTSPRLEAFAEHATTYAAAYSPSNATLPTHASLFTGLWPSEHGAHAENPGWRPLAASIPRLPQMLKDVGYITASIAANYNFLGSGFGLDQGFDYVDARPPDWTPFGNPPRYALRSEVAGLLERLGITPGNHLLKRTAAEINGTTIQLLNRLRGAQRPFFLYVNYMDAHSLCLPPEPYSGMFGEVDSSLPRDAFNAKLETYHLTGTVDVTKREQQDFVSQYDAAIAYEDAAFGALISALQARGLLEGSLVILTADHGEAFGDRGIIGHGTSTYNDQVRVPLIVKWPNQTAGSLVQDATTTLRVYDWIREAAGLGAAPSERPVIVEAFPVQGRGVGRNGAHTGRALVNGTFKLIDDGAGGREIYDMVADPGETTNLVQVPAMAPVETELAGSLALWRGRHVPSVPQVVPSLSEAAERRLRSLGYVN